MATVLRANCFKTTYKGDNTYDYRDRLVASLPDGTSRWLYHGQAKGRLDRWIAPGAILVKQLNPTGPLRVVGQVYRVEMLNMVGITRAYCLHVRPITLVCVPEALAIIVPFKTPGKHMFNMLNALFHFTMTDLSGNGSGNKMSGIVRVTKRPRCLPLIPPI